MNLRNVFGIVLVLCFAFSLAAPVFAVSAQAGDGKLYTILDSNFDFNAKPGKPGTTTQSVGIRNLAQGDNVFEQVLIVGQATGTPTSVTYQVNGGSEIVMQRVGSTDRYEDLWAIGSDLKGTQPTLTVKATYAGSAAVSNSATVNVLSDVQWQVNFEIDYIEGHAPTQAVLNYMTGYWRSRGIDVTYLPTGTAVTDPTPGDGEISDSDFWAIEALNNQGTDKATDANGRDYYLPEKWVLYGTKYTTANVGGYCWCPIVRGDDLGGNYIFLADESIEGWQGTISGFGVETVVLCHEAGHSIGVLVARGNSEKYDTDYYSVMSLIRNENSFGMTNYWYYSKEYWITANLGNYAI